MRSRALPLAAVAIALCGAALTGGDVQPANDLPNPYQTVAPWGNLPDGRIYVDMTAKSVRGNW